LAKLQEKWVVSVMKSFSLFYAQLLHPPSKTKRTRMAKGQRISLVCLWPNTNYSTIPAISQIIPSDDFVRKRVAVPACIMMIDHFRMIGTDTYISTDNLFERGNLLSINQ
jgi:hypothetical protein